MTEHITHSKYPTLKCRKNEIRNHKIRGTFWTDRNFCRPLTHRPPDGSLSSFSFDRLRLARPSGGKTAILSSERVRVG
ncbi:hypothetical protein CEXT_793141 [Caerostris extrusa]|uniref:Uncharacterized protein n=1 Tax=Caerostris extrusa TaxID=172846 RepID=A0AAV4V5V1_CAEEX|nr:hypothetical protein CEXT_793141 [Caerostris extrusa]